MHTYMHTYPHIYIMHAGMPSLMISPQKCVTVFTSHAYIHVYIPTHIHHARWRAKPYDFTSEMCNCVHITCMHICIYTYIYIMHTGQAMPCTLEARGRDYSCIHAYIHTHISIMCTGRPPYGFPRRIMHLFSGDIHMLA
jgi:hypothetical protein